MPRCEALHLKLAVSLGVTPDGSGLLLFLMLMLSGWPKTSSMQRGRALHTLKAGLWGQSKLLGKGPGGKKGLGGKRGVEGSLLPIFPTHDKYCSLQFLSLNKH